MISSSHYPAPLQYVKLDRHVGICEHMLLLDPLVSMSMRCVPCWWMINLRKLWRTVCRMYWWLVVSHHYYYHSSPPSQNCNASLAVLLIYDPFQSVACGTDYSWRCTSHDLAPLSHYYSRETNTAFVLVEIILQPSRPYCQLWNQHV